MHWEGEAREEEVVACDALLRLSLQLFKCIWRGGEGRVMEEEVNACDAIQG